MKDLRAIVEEKRGKRAADVAARERPYEGRLSPKEAARRTRQLQGLKKPGRR